MLPDGYEELCAKGRAAAREHKTSEAVVVFQQAISIRPDDPTAFDGLASAYCVAKDIDNAIVNFTRVMQLKPRDAKALVNLGALYNLKEDYKKATDVLRKAIQRDNRSADAYYNLGIAEKHLGQLAMAISSYRECVRLKPDMVDAHMNLANCYVEHKQFKKAIEHYQAVLKTTPQSIKAQRGLLHAQQLLDESKQANSPFGRLVDESKLHLRDEAIATTRILSVEEQLLDRQFVQELADKHTTLAKGFAKQLHEQMEHCLSIINRILLHDNDQQQSLFDEREHFSSTLEFTQQIYKQLKAQADQLRQHELGLK